MPSPHRNAIHALIAAVALALVGARPLQTASASTITVTSAAQEQPFVTNGNCTLGEAIQAANTESPVDECAAGSGEDTIQLAAGQIYTLTRAADTALDGDTGLPLITTAISIAGDGAIIQRDTGPATPPFRLFRITAGGRLMLTGVTVRGGRVVGADGPQGQHAWGGAILSNGQLRLLESMVADSEAIGGASTMAGKEGGGGAGGGIALHGGSANGWIERSTISGNRAVGGASAPGAPVSSAAGGGLEVYLTGVNGAEISNSTISGNQAVAGTGGISSGGGIALNGGGIFLRWSTVTANSAVGEQGFGGGVSVLAGSIEHTGAILAGNSAATDFSDCDGEPAYFRATGYSLLGEGGGCPVSAAAGDRATGAALLGLLGDNGGPTLTHALLPGSPARDALDLLLCPATDQRGVSRPQGAGCDIGAVEYVPYDLTSTPTSSPTSTATQTSTPTSSPTATATPVATPSPIRVFLPIAGSP